MDLWTYKDAVESLLDFCGNDTGATARRDARRAAREALRELGSLHRWSYYYRTGRIATLASYSTGTVVYDHTGGAYERMLTLTDGTWPSWAAYGSVLIGSVVYDAFERKSDSIITLHVNANPGADVASTTYQMFRDSFPMPEDFISIDRMITLDNNWVIPYVHPRDWLADHRWTKSPGEPDMFTIIGDPNYQSVMAARFSPPPSSARTIDFLYRRRARELNIEEYNTGTVTVSGNGATATGTGTAWDSRHVGCSIRLSENSTAPTGREGSNPFVVERIVLSVQSTTGLTVDAGWPSSLTNVKYTLSDPVDLDVNIMLNLFQRCAEKQLAHRRRPADRQIIEGAFQQEMYKALGADSRFDGERVCGAYRGGVSNWLDRASLGDNVGA